MIKRVVILSIILIVVCTMGLYEYKLYQDRTLPIVIDFNKINTVVTVHMEESLRGDRIYPIEKIDLPGAGNYTITAQTRYPNEAAAICHTSEFVAYREDRFGNHTDIYTHGWPGVVYEGCYNYLGITNDNTIINKSFVVSTDEIHPRLEIGIPMNNYAYSPKQASVDISVVRIS